MQLIKKYLKFTTVIGVFLVGMMWLSPIRFVPHGDADLQRTPLGSQFKERPLTGVIYKFYPDFRLAKLELLLGGKRHGVTLHWYANGQRWIERHYNEGLEVGRHYTWYQDGRVNSEKSFLGGVAHGDTFEWHPNGQLAQFVKYDSGVELAAKSWTSGGKPFYNYIKRNGVPVGLKGDTFCSVSN